MSVDDLLDLDGDLITLPSQRLELLCEPGEHQRGGVGAGHHDGLLAERGHDLCRPDTTFAGRVLQQRIRSRFSPAVFIAAGGKLVALQQVQDRGVIQPRPEHAFQRRGGFG